MSSQPENEQTALENVNANISQEIRHEPNKLADNIGVVAQEGSVVGSMSLFWDSLESQ